MSGKGEQRVTIFRVVDPTELAVLQRTGSYGSNPNRSGKYFAFTREGAKAFASAPVNAQSIVTSTTLPIAVIGQGVRFNDPGQYGAGSSVFFAEMQLSTVFGSMTPPMIVEEF